MISKNKLPFNILNPTEQTAARRGFSCTKVLFPKEKCTFLNEESAVSSRKCAHGKKPQEIARGIQGSKIRRKRPQRFLGWWGGGRNPTLCRLYTLKWNYYETYFWDAAFLLTVGSFLLTVELFFFFFTYS